MIKMAMLVVRTKQGSLSATERVQVRKLAKTIFVRMIDRQSYSSSEDVNICRQMAYDAADAFVRGEVDYGDGEV